MTTANTPAVTRAWRGYRRWRRSRPFWGGFFAILAGIEMFATTQSFQGFEIKLGVEGFLSILIPLMLVLGGLLSWISPGQRQFYGILTVFVAVFSLIGVNFGGFFIGLLFGVIGGGLTFAWNPTRTIPTADADPADGPGTDDDGPSGRHAAPETSVDELLDAGDDRHTAGGLPHQRPASPDEEPDRQPRRSPRLFAIVVPLALLATGLVAIKGVQPVYADCTPSHTPPSSTAPSPDTTTAPDPATPEPVPTPTAAAEQPAANGLINGLVDVVTGVLGGGTKTANAAVEPTPTAADPEPTTAPTTPGATAPPKQLPKPTRTCAPTHTPPRPAKRLAAAAGQEDVAIKPGRMQGTQVTMVNLVFQGIVDLPTATGTTTVLKFTMDSSTTDDFTLRVYGGKYDLLQSTKSLTVKTDVVFYTSRFQGNLFGAIPVDYTPSNPPPAVPLPLVFFTNPDIQLVLVNTNTLTAKPTLSMKFVAPE